MSGLVVALLVASGIWMVFLSLVILLLLRQAALLTVRASLVGPSVAHHSGPEVGSELSGGLAAQFPQLELGDSLLLVLSATCQPCREIAVHLGKTDIPQHAVAALLLGEREAATILLQVLPDWVDVVEDPQASKLASVLNVQTSPFSIVLHDGVVVRKAHIRGIEDLGALARPMSAEGVTQPSISGARSGMR